MSATNVRNSHSRDKNWTIRKAKASDADGLRECMDASYSTYLERFSGNRLPPMDVDYSSEIKHYPVWVAESDGIIVGGLIMVFDEPHPKLANIAVHPKFKGQGLGKRLIAYAESAARERGYTELRLATHTLLTENVSLYLHLGWTEISRDEVRVSMKKAL